MTNEKPALRHFRDIDLIARDDLKAILAMAHKMKKEAFRAPILNGLFLALLFEKPSTRTRVSFDVAMRQLGGEVLYLSASDMNLSRGETVGDTARILSRYVDIITLRTNEASLDEFMAHTAIPVINGLTEKGHPCQIMADIMTFEEHKGSLEGHKVAWVGDGNNVAISWVQAAAHFGFSLHLATPSGLEVNSDIIEKARKQGADIMAGSDAEKAVQDASLVTTDTWVSMNDKDDPALRKESLNPFQVNAALMAKASPQAIFMHCLPAHRGEEVTDDVIDGPQSVVWDEAENRLHIQKAILVWCLGKKI